MTDTELIRETILKKKLCSNEVGRMCKVSPTTVTKLMRDVNAKFKKESIASLFKGLGIGSPEPFELTPPGADLDNLILRAKGIIKSYDHIQRQSKLALEEWNVYMSKLMGLHGKVDEIRKTLGVIGELQVGEDVGAQSTLTGNPIIDFVDNGGSPDTIVRASGDFLVDDEFLDGMSIVVTNTISNNNTFTIDTVTATTITLIAGDALTTETVATNTSIVGTPSLSNPRPAKVTETDSSMSLINIPTDTTPFTIGYASTTSVSFSTTVSGDVVLVAYPSETTKIITSAGLYTGNDNVFAYKRFPQKSISALINIDITWTIQF